MLPNTTAFLIETWQLKPCSQQAKNEGKDKAIHFTFSTSECT